MTRNFSTKNISRKMEVEAYKLNESQLSSACINCVAKQLNSSRPEDPMESKSRGKARFCKISQDHSKDMRYLSESQQESKPTSINSPIPMKRVRRRLHTSKPYQERLLNLAEARREIVTALKLHRATKKHATELQKFQQKQHHNPSPSPTLELSPPVLEAIQKELNENRINFTTHPFDYTFSNHLQNTNLLPYEYHSFPWMRLPITPILVHENLNITCHNHPLGLDPKLQSLSNRNNSLGDKLYWKSTMQPSSQSTPSSSSSPESITASFQASCLSKSSCHASCDALDAASRALHPRMDADEIAEIHLIGEQHGMEWNDKMNMMASAWWSKFLRNMDDGFCEDARGENIGSHMSNEKFNVLSCLTNGNAREPCLLEQCMWKYYDEEDYLPDGTFPW